MAKRAFPNLGLTGGYAPGDDGWGDEQNANLLMLSTVVQGGVIGRVAAVPAAPAQGDVYVLTADPNKGAVAVYDNAAWTYFAPKEGWLFYDRGTDNYVSFDGAAWQDLVTSGGGGGGGLEDAPSDGKLYARQDGAWVEVVSGGGGGGSGSSPIFAHVTFECDYSSKAITYVGDRKNVVSVVRLDAGVFRVNFTAPYSKDVGNLNVIMATRKGPYSDYSDSYPVLNRNYNAPGVGGASNEPGLALGYVIFRCADEGRMSVTILDSTATSGGGGGSASGPTIVQTAAFRKGGALTLPNAPKDGNYIVLVWTGFPNNQQQPPGFAKVDQVQSNNNNGVAIYVRRYVAGDPTVWNVGSTSDSGWAVYEISKLKNITRNSSTVGSLGLNGNAFSVPIPLQGDGIYVFAFEQDNAPNFVLDVKAGQVIDATLTAASGENHSGLVGHLTADWVSPAITGTLDQPLAPVFAAWNLT